MAHKGVFLVAVGIRYKGYCSNAGRTFIVDPSKVGLPIAYTLIFSRSVQEQEAIYNLLVSLQAHLLKVIKDGVTAREAYQQALAYVKDKNPDIEQRFVKNIGFGVPMVLLVLSAYVDTAPNRWVWSSVTPLICFRPRMPGR
jgi:nucleosome binding factor SPN SPT16 subunit